MSDTGAGAQLRANGDTGVGDLRVTRVHGPHKRANIDTGAGAPKRERPATQVQGVHKRANGDTGVGAGNRGQTVTAAHGRERELLTRASSAAVCDGVDDSGDGPAHVSDVGDGVSVDTFCV